MTLVDVEIFPCSGGMAEGFRRAGIVFDLAIDKDPDAAESYAHNLGHRPILIDVRDLLRMVQLGWRAPIRLLVADPPCTPWSNAGKRLGLEDERDCLQVTVDLIRLLRPTAYLIGNVPGLDTAPHIGTVQRTIGSLSRDGYCTADYASLDAADFGVPQRRIRPFWFGHLDGPCLKWPRPTHGDPKTIGHAELGEERQPWVTCREALQGLPEDEIGRPVRVVPRRRCHPISRPDEPSLGIPASQPGNGGAVVAWDPDGDHRPSDPDAPSKTIVASQKGHGDGCVIAGWPWDRPSTTVFAESDITGGPGKGSICLRPNAIKLTERAAAILQGFPESWLFAGKTKRSRWSQIGQAMPPPLAHAVASSVTLWLVERELRCA